MTAATGCPGDDGKARLLLAGQECRRLLSILLSTGGMQTVFTQRGLEQLVKKAIWTFWRGLQTDPPATETWFQEE